MEGQVEGYSIRKWCEFFEEAYENETGQFADGEPVRKFAVGVVICNPYAGKYEEKLDKLLARSGELGEVFGARFLRSANGQPIVSYGKSCIVGVNGEYEHGNACLTTAFADPIRQIIGGGKAWIPSTGKVGVPGTSIDIPLAHKQALYVRSHYDTFTISVHDAPRPNEILILFAGASRGRLKARLGGLEADQIKGSDGLV